ncbi:amino acid permease-domain-containing protein [Aspergillus venezuelensis]
MPDLEKPPSEINASSPPTGLDDTSSMAEGQIRIHEDERRMSIRFNLWSTLGLVYSTTATPIAVGSYLTFSLELGESPYYTYCYIFAVGLNIILCAALADIAAVYPHSSGHIYWIEKLVPERYVNVLSYRTGALTSAAWFLWTAGTYLLTAQILTAVAMALKPSYTAQQWHILLISWAQALVSALWNIPLFKTWPASLKSMVVITNAGVLFLAVALLVRTSPKQSARELSTGFDAVAHMVDEMPDPARQVPQVMVGNALLSGILGLPMTIIFCFCISNRENLLDPVGGVTIIQLFLDSLRSTPLFVLSSLLYIVVTIAAGTAVTTTTSRVLWSFSTHHGLLFSSWFSQFTTTSIPRVSTFTLVPANAILTVAILSSIVLILTLGPSFVLGSFFGAANICFYISYALTISAFFYAKWCAPQLIADSISRPRPFTLGRIMSAVSGIISILWCIFASVWLVFPYYPHVTTANMIYAIVIVGIVLVIFGADWAVRAKRVYIMPTAITH